MNTNKEKLLYLLGFIESDIEDLIYKVLNDSKTDPHYSAVTATNMLKCYVEVMNDLGEKLPYSNMQEFFVSDFFTEEEYRAFEESREKESKYYIGKQYWNIVNHLKL